MWWNIWVFHEILTPSALISDRCDSASPTWTASGILQEKLYLWLGQFENSSCANASSFYNTRSAELSDLCDPTQQLGSNNFGYAGYFPLLVLGISRIIYVFFPFTSLIFNLNPLTRLSSLTSLPGSTNICVNLAHHLLCSLTVFTVLTVPTCYLQPKWVY